MTVIIDKFKIDSSLFRNCCINERLCLVYFIHRPQALEGEIMFPVLFDNVCDTRRFYMEYHYAMYDNDLSMYSSAMRISVRNYTTESVSNHINHEDTSQKHQY